jgi:hypothetical protein
MRSQSISAVLLALLAGSSCGPTVVRRVTTVPTSRAQGLIAECVKTEGKEACNRLCMDVFNEPSDVMACGFERDGENTDVWYETHKSDPGPAQKESGCAGGRRPAGLAELACVAPSHAAAYLAFTAQLEAASITAFARVHQQVTALGGSTELLARIRDAIADELAHAHAMVALARRYGVEPAAPSIADVELDAVGQAIENIVEGCIGEAVAALHAAHAAVHCSDPVVRDVFARIAADETQHALLAHDLVALYASRLDADGRRRVLDTLAATLGRRVYRDLPAGLAELGVPDDGSLGAAVDELLAGIAPRLIAAHA